MQKKTAFHALHVIRKLGPSFLNVPFYFLINYERCSEHGVCSSAISHLSGPKRYILTEYSELASFKVNSQIHQIFFTLPLPPQHEGDAEQSHGCATHVKISWRLSW